MKKYILSSVVTLAFMGVVFVPSAHAETTTPTSTVTSTPSTTSSSTIEAMLAQIKTLMAKIEELKKQLGTVRGEVKSTLKEGISSGQLTPEDVKKIQEILATDPTIYPEGKITGFFGPLTKEALKRFQKRHGLTASGTLDMETHDLLEQYLSQGSTTGQIPPGLLRAPGIMKKVEDRFKLGCGEHNHGMGILCRRLNGNGTGSTTASTTVGIHGLKMHENEDEQDDDKNGSSTENGDSHKGKGKTVPLTF